MEGSIFETINKEPKEKKLTISIPIELDESINNVINELKIKAPDLRFNSTSICVNALNRAVKKAQRELEKMKGKPSSLGSNITTETNKAIRN